MVVRREVSDYRCRLLLKLRMLWDLFVFVIGDGDTIPDNGYVCMRSLDWVWMRKKRCLKKHLKCISSAFDSN